MSQPPGPSWPVSASADPHRRPVSVVAAAGIAVVWSVVVLGLAVLFGVAPTAGAWRRADPTGLLPHGTWWRAGLATTYVLWCALGLWFAVAAHLRRGWAAVALLVSASLALVLSGYELRTVVDVPVPLGCLTSALLVALPASRRWYAAREV